MSQKYVSRERLEVQLSSRPCLACIVTSAGECEKKGLDIDAAVDVASNSLRVTCEYEE